MTKAGTPRTEQMREQHRKWCAAHPEYQRRYRANHAEQVRETGRKYRAANPERAWGASLRRDFGISIADYNAMLASQGGVCAICGTDKPDHKRKHFRVDHDHETKKVRGLLCHNCNVAAGLLKNSAEVADSMARYLRGNK